MNWLLIAGLDQFFFLTTATHRSCLPIKGGGGWYIPNRGAPWPSCFPLVLLPDLGALPPVFFFTSSTARGIPVVARMVPRPLPICVFVGCIRTPEPVWRALRISLFWLLVRRYFVRNQLIDFIPGYEKASYLASGHPF